MINLIWETLFYFAVGLIAGITSFTIFSTFF